MESWFNISMRPRAIGYEQIAHLRAFMLQGNGRCCIKMCYILTPTPTLDIGMVEAINICIGYSWLEVGKSIHVYDWPLGE
jgi:hypothetical protein